MAVGGKSSWFSERGPCSASSSPRPRADPGCRWSHAIPKDKTKPFTPGFNSDLAAAGLKSAGDGQRGGRVNSASLLPSPSPLFFTPFLSNWPGLLRRNWENKQPMEFGGCWRGPGGAAAPGRRHSWGFISSLPRLGLHARALGFAPCFWSRRGLVGGCGSTMNPHFLGRERLFLLSSLLFSL